MGNKSHRISISGSSPASGALYLIAIQVVSRILTFLANQILLQHITPGTLGLAAQIELYSITALLFSRESIRLATQRLPESSKKPIQSYTSDKDPQNRREHVNHCFINKASQTVVNISYLGIIIGLVMVYGLGEAYLHMSLRDATYAPIVRRSFTIVQIATVLELLAEPLFLVIQQKMLYRTRAVIEMASSVIKSISSCAIALYMVNQGHGDPGVLPFAVGQFGYSLCLLCGYVMATVSIARRDGFYLYPVRITDKATSVFRFISPYLLSLSANLYMQSIAKHILTQSDSMILIAFSSLEAQGQYALVSNYGGLLARVVFQPIEENSRHVFGKLLSRKSTERTEPGAVSVIKATLCDILHGYALFSILVCAGGPAASSLTVKYIIGSRWKSPGMQGLLSAYCYYVPFLAFNGITEAFVSSAASNAELRLQTRWMGVFSLVFAAAAYLFLKASALGVYGLLLANMVNMLLRIVWSWWFINAYFKSHNYAIKARDAIPSLSTCIAGVIGCFALHPVQFATRSDIEDILKTVSTGACLVVTILYFERKFLKRIISMYLTS